MPSPRSQNHLQAALFAAAMGMAIPLAFQHFTVTFQADPTTVGILAAVFGGVQVVVRVPVGRVLDARGERGPLRWSWSLTVAAGAVLSVGPTLWWAAAGFLLFGLGVGAFWVAANTLAARLSPPGALAQGMTRYNVAIGAGFLVGPLLGGVADLVGFAPALGLLVPFGLVGLVLVGPIPSEAPVPEPAGPGQGPGPGLRLGLVTAFFFGWFVGTSDAFVPTRLSLVGYSALGVGLFVSAREAVNLAARLTTARVVEDRWARALLVVGTGAAAVGLVVFPRVTGPVGLAMAAAALGVAVGLTAPASLTVTARGSPAGTTGRSMGAWGTALGLGLLIGPAVLGPVGDAFGLHWVFDLTAVLAVATALVTLVGPRWARTAPGSPRP